MRWKCVIHMTMEVSAQEFHTWPLWETMSENHLERVPPWESALYKKTFFSCVSEREGLTSLRRTKMYCAFPFFTINGWSLSQLLYILATLCVQSQDSTLQPCTWAHKSCANMELTKLSISKHIASKFHRGHFEVCSKFPYLNLQKIVKFTENS